MNGSLSRIKVPVSYYSQTADECVNLYDASSRAALKNRQFEWASCGEHHNEVETGILEWELNEEGLPVAVGGKNTANRGVFGENFQRWFKAADGLSEAQDGDFILADVNGVLSFESSDFHPVNGLFTMKFDLSFEVSANGEEQFEIAADDDTFVFVDGRLVIDMGGIHSKTTGRFIVNENAEVYAAVGNESFAYAGVNLKSGKISTISVFHANRDSKDSVFSMKAYHMALSASEAAESGTASTDLGYMEPLGETLTVGVNQEKILATTNSVKMMSFGLIGVVAALIIFAVVKYLRHGHNRVK